jgi:hypothetical protein
MAFSFRERHGAQERFFKSLDSLMKKIKHDKGNVKPG